MSKFLESIVEDAALDGCQALGYSVLFGADIAPDMPGAERADYGQVILQARLRAVLARLNPTLPTEAIEEASRKLNRSDGPSPEVSTKLTRFAEF